MHVVSYGCGVGEHTVMSLYILPRSLPPPRHIAAVNLHPLTCGAQKLKGTAPTRGDDCILHSEPSVGNSPTTLAG